MKQYLFGFLFSSNAKKSYADQCILQVFNSVSKETSHKPSKAAAEKNVSPGCVCVCVCVIRTTCFDECFLFHVMIRGY